MAGKDINSNGTLANIARDFQLKCQEVTTMLIAQTAASVDFEQKDEGLFTEGGLWGRPETDAYSNEFENLKDNTMETFKILIITHRSLSN